MNNTYAQSPRFTSSQAIETMVAAHRQFASSPTIKAIETARRQFAASPTIKTMETAHRQFAASPTIKAMMATQQQLASSPAIKAMVATQQQLASSPAIKAMVATQQQLASSPAIKAMVATQQQLASSPAIKAMVATQQQLASSPAIKAMVATQQRLASSPLFEAMIGAQRDLASFTTYSKEISTRQLASTTIYAPRRVQVLGEHSVRPSRVNSTVVGVRQSPNVGVAPKVTDLQPGSYRWSPKTTERLRLFDFLVTDGNLHHTCRKLFADGHYAIAVEKAFVCFNNAVKEKSGLTTQDGAELMRAAFSANSPTLYLNSFLSTSDKDEQRGYMEIFAGVMTGIRNPRVHEHDMEDDPETALELLIFANHLMKKLSSASKGKSI